jgi:hypothetical protein
MGAILLLFDGERNYSEDGSTAGRSKENGGDARGTKRGEEGVALTSRKRIAFGRFFCLALDL